MTSPVLLAGDIGGTNARFALADPEGAGYSRLATLRCAEFETVELAIDHYLRQVQADRPAAVCIAAAGPVVDNQVRLTNNHWFIDAAGLGDRFGRVPVRLLNDFEAIACSIPFLQGDAIEQIGLVRSPLDPQADFTVGVMGPGTGLGVAGLMGRDGSMHPIVGEGSHVGFAPENRLQFDVLQQLRERFERVSVERLVSGPGLENVYWAIGRLHGRPAAHASAAEIFARAESGSDSVARESVNLFFEVLGQAAGNLALTIGAGAGVYIAGGIVKRYPELLRGSPFRSGFENKGRHRGLMERIATLLILHPQPGLLGAAWCARQELARHQIGRIGAGKILQ